MNTDKKELFNENGESRGYYSSKNQVNNLTGKEWQYWSKSVITRQYPRNFQHKLRNEHGGQKPPDLCADLIKVFTKEKMNILDPFAGVGGTLLGASLCNRKAVGMELSKKWGEIYGKVCDLEGIKKQRMIIGDSKNLLKKEKKNSYDMILTDVPYWDMDKTKKSKNKFKKVGEQSKENKRSKLSQFNDKEQTKEEWLNEMKEIFSLTYPLLNKNRYLVVFIGDMYKNGRYHFLSNDLARVLEDIGFIPKANLIWYDVSNRLHIYAYCYQYIPSMIHQNILVFRKEN
jgi:DNA modification methylase